MKKTRKKQSRNPIIKEMEKLMSQQTGLILDVVDGRFNKTDQKFNKIDKRFDEVDQRFNKLEARIDKVEEAISELRNTLDRFLKQLTDFNDEFIIVKARLAKVEKILEEKLGIVID